LREAALALMGASLAWLMLGRGGGAGGDFMRGTGERLPKAATDTAESVRAAADRASRATADKGTDWSEKASGLRNEAAESLRPSAEDARQAAAPTSDNIRDVAGSMRDSAQQMASETADAVREKSGRAADSVQRYASAGYDTVADTAHRTTSSISEAAKVVGQRTVRTSGSFLDFCREQPVLLAGLGIAIGALAGALLPATESENRLMGETSDSLKEQAQEVASEEVESAKKIGERALDAATDEAVRDCRRGRAAGRTGRAGAPPAAVGSRVARAALEGR
jgi:hypothetical protein